VWLASLVGLFGRTPKDPLEKNNVEELKKFKKLVKDKKYDQAIKSGTEYLLRVPNNHDVLFTMGGICYLKNRHGSAVSYFDMALEIGAYDVDVLLLKAYSHQKLGEKRKAIECCEKIREVDPKNQSVSELLSELS